MFRKIFSLISLLKKVLISVKIAETALSAMFKELCDGEFLSSVNKMIFLADLILCKVFLYIS